jgi:hypothetical protein
MVVVVVVVFMVVKDPNGKSKGNHTCLFYVVAYLRTLQGKQPVTSMFDV